MIGGSSTAARCPQRTLLRVPHHARRKQATLLPTALQGRSNRGTGKFGDDWSSKLSPQVVKSSHAQDKGRLWMMR